MVHEWHEFIWKSGHGASNANSSNIWATPYAGHPSPLADVALHNRTPASQLHDAVTTAVSIRELGLLVVAAPVASFVHRLAKQPRRSEGIVKRDHGGPARRHVQ